VPRTPRAFVFALALVARAAVTPAQTVIPAPVAAAADVERARAAFGRGVLLAQQDRWSEALDAFRESRRAADRPRTAFNVGLALQHLGRLRDARAALRECIAMPGVLAEADLAADANALEAEVSRSLARLRLVMEPANAEVRVNAEVMADDRGEPLRNLALDPGSQEVEVSAPGLAPQRFTIAPHSGESLQRRVNLAVVPGRVAVNVEQHEATVSIDDEVVGHGSTVWQGSPGAHRVRVEAEGYRPYRRPVTVVAGGDLRVEVSLATLRAPWFQSPWLWGGVGLAVVGGVVAALLIERTAAPDGGNTQQVFQGATVRW
jgi:hypothetical protein